MMSEVTSLASLEFAVQQKLETNKTRILPHGISGVAVVEKLEINKTGILPHGISGVAVLEKMEINKTWSNMTLC